LPEGSGSAGRPKSGIGLRLTLLSRSPNLRSVAFVPKDNACFRAFRVSELLFLAVDPLFLAKPNMSG
jgi:hypothetical protein